MRLHRPFSRLRRDDEGIAVITVVLLTSVVTALLITSTVVTVNNLGNASRDRQSLSALSTAEAGLAQAVQFLRGGNLGALTCIEPAVGVAPGVTCQGATASWISATNPRQVALTGTPGACSAAQNCFKVWIGTVQKYVANCAARRATPPGSCFGIYRVHATGLAGSGPGARRLVADIKVTPYPFPIGVYADAFSGNGNIGIHSESLFTNGCVKNRQNDAASGSGFQFQYDSAAGRPVLDLIYDQPISAHAIGAISTSNNSCGSGSGGQPIHQTANCNATFKWDQDGDGGAIAAPCLSAYTRSDGSTYPLSSKFTAADLQNYGYRPRGLTDAVCDSLRSQAQAQGTYNIGAAAISAKLTALAAAGITSPVLYWDNADVDIKQSDFPASYSRALNQSATCTAAGSVTIVVAGHDLKYTGGNSSPYLVASILVPDGGLTGQGGRNTIGTVFAKDLDLGGNVDFYMDECFVNNPPGATLDATSTNWREDDGTDTN